MDRVLRVIDDGVAFYERQIERDEGTTLCIPDLPGLDRVPFVTSDAASARPRARTR